MKQRELLYKIYYENKAVNRNLQRLINVDCAGAPGAAAKEFKLKGDKYGVSVVKAGCRHYFRNGSMEKRMRGADQDSDRNAF